MDRPETTLDERFSDPGTSATTWDGQWKLEVRDRRFHHDAGSALVFRVDPRKVLAFGKGPFSQTRYEA
jgi:hypothetical protein